jgi:hypothetical protein
MPEVNRFEKAAAARGVKKADRTQSWGKEQTAKALQGANQQHNRFGAPNLPAERKLAPATAQAPALVINGRKYTDPKLIDAKNAMEQGKVDAARVSKIRSRILALQQDSASIRALFEGWMHVRQQFYPSPFNMENMSRALTSLILQGDEPMSVKLCDDAFAYLTANNYLEKAIRRRGEPAARLYPEYIPPVEESVAAPEPVRHVVTSEERAQFKSLTFDEHAAAARALYKKGQ